MLPRSLAVASAPEGAPSSHSDACHPCGNTREAQIQDQEQPRATGWVPRSQGTAPPLKLACTKSHRPSVTLGREARSTPVAQMHGSVSGIQSLFSPPQSFSLFAGLAAAIRPTAAQGNAQYMRRRRPQLPYRQTGPPATSSYWSRGAPRQL
jgi:hypothetical protein